jgi:tetratricopeptide (TPR) repeat protein
MRVTVVVLLAAALLAAASEPVTPEQAAEMAEHGRCAEALPPLKRALGQVQDKDLKRRVGLAGVRCAMTLRQSGEATEFLTWLDRQFPQDPEILYAAVHVYSDLSLRASQDLLYSAPASPQVRQLNAEALEAQGKWKEALDEYRLVLERAPNMHGIHFRIGRLILSQPATPTTAEDAQREFEAELKIDPANAGAEYVLGELAHQAQRTPEAISHLTRATRLDVAFADAYVALGRTLLDAERPAEAIPPLETAVKLEPENPTHHFLLATAYQRTGRREDAAREFAAHKAGAEKAQKASQNLRRGVSAGEAPKP